MISQEVRRQINDYMIGRHRDAWSDAITKNIPAIMLKKKIPRKFLFRDKVIVLGAGPSTDMFGTWDKLSKYRDSYMLIAVDMAVKPALSHGIEPDLIVTTDNHPDVKRMLDHGRKIPTMFPVYGDHETIMQCKGRRLFYVPENVASVIGDNLDDFSGLPWVVTLGNVAGQGLAIADFVLAAKNVALVGVDLAFPWAGDGIDKYKKYCSGTIHEGTPSEYYRERSDSPTSPEFKMRGTRWVSDEVFKIYLHSLDVYVSQLVGELSEMCTGYEPCNIYSIDPILTNILSDERKIIPTTIERFIDSSIQVL